MTTTPIDPEVPGPAQDPDIVGPGEDPGITPDVEPDPVPATEPVPPA